MRQKLQTAYKKWTWTVASALTLLTMPLLAAPAAGAHGLPGNSCNQNVIIRVALAPGQAADQTIAGTLCTPRGHGQPTVDVLVHGATYTRSYWDFPYASPEYSYVQRALAANRAVFFYDRLGVGQSSHLDSTKVTMASDTEALHQVITYMKQHEHFRSVNVVGHSFGSMIAIQEASVYNDMDRLVATGSLQSTGLGLINGEIKTYPANQDPEFQGKGYDKGWLTSVPGRKGVFYYAPTADPHVIAYDDAHEGVQSSTQLGEGRVNRTLPPASNPTSKVRVPVLLIDGQQDRLYCQGATLDCTNTAAVKAFEQPYYPLVQRLDVVTIPDTGHDLTLHPSAGLSAWDIDHWLRTTPAYHR